MSASQGSESPTVEELQALDLQCEQSSVEKWNRLYPIGTEIRYNDSNGHAVDTTTRSNAEVYALPRNETRKYAPIHVAGICLQGIETPVRLDCCFPKIPKELEFLLENLPAQDLRNKFEQFRDGLDITAVLYALAANSEDDNEHSDDTPELPEGVDLIAALPSLAGFKKYIGEENQFLLTAKSPQGTLELFLAEKWWDDFCEQRQKAMGKVDEDREAIYERMGEERERKEEDLFKQLHALIDEDDVRHITTQRAMRAYALDKIPALGEVDDDRLTEEIQKLSDKVKLSKRK